MTAPTIRRPNTRSQGTEPSGKTAGRSPVARGSARGSNDAKQEQQRDPRKRSDDGATVRSKQSPYPSSRQRLNRRVTRQHSNRLRNAAPVEPARQKNSGLNITLEKFFTLIGFLVGTVIVLMCALDLIVAVPFFQANAIFDVGFLISGTILLLMSWDARDACR